MHEETAKQISELLNLHNQLTVPYTVEKILDHFDSYVVQLNEKLQVLGVVEVKKVQWYQCEICHLSVHPKWRGQGVAKRLLQDAEEKARHLVARIVQCTIRVGNAPSEGLFKKHGYLPTVTFLNQQSGNNVTVYQKVLEIKT